MLWMRKRVASCQLDRLCLRVSGAPPQLYQLHVWTTLQQCKLMLWTSMVQAEILGDATMQLTNMVSEHSSWLRQNTDRQLRKYRCSHLLPNDIVINPAEFVQVAFTCSTPFAAVALACLTGIVSKRKSGLVKYV